MTEKGQDGKPSILSKPIQIFEKPVEPSKEEFERLRDFIRQNCGISLGDDKMYLITQRLGPLLKGCSCKNFTELHQLLLKSETSSLKDKVVEAITTNETSFFRDVHPFETFKDLLLPELISKFRASRLKPSEKPRRMRIWCAASSSGQEPYSLAMIINERLDSGTCPDIKPGDFHILATDISTEMLSRAQKGRYNSVEISRGLTEDAKVKYFKESGGFWTISQSMRSMVEFKQINLIKQFSMLGEFDMISCRNVLIYFDEKTKSRILDQFADMLPKGGLMLLGAMENTYCLSSRFHSRRHGKTIVYERA